MPRQARIDASGALHHIIVRGIDRKKIFKDDHDRHTFLERLGGILATTQTACLAWALIPNYAHLLELVRYIHLNPLRAKLVADYQELQTYSFCGHSTIVGKVVRNWQKTDFVLSLFASKLPEARIGYLQFVEDGIAMGLRQDLVGGGLLRSQGGWAAVKEMRNANAYQKGDERILGDGDFVEEVLRKAGEKLERKFRLNKKQRCPKLIFKNQHMPA